MLFIYNALAMSEILKYLIFVVEYNEEFVTLLFILLEKCLTEWNPVSKNHFCLFDTCFLLIQVQMR
jgi:hypothetical protein